MSRPRRGRRADRRQSSRPQQSTLTSNGSTKFLLLFRLLFSRCRKARCDSWLAKVSSLARVIAALDGSVT